MAREIDVHCIKIDTVIGRGEFGEVCKGKLVHKDRKKGATYVAVKRLRSGASLLDQTNFLREACTMAQFSDPNIIQLRGVVTKSKYLYKVKDRKYFHLLFSVILLSLSI